MFIKGTAIFKTIGFHGFFVGASDLGQALDLVTGMVRRDAALIDVELADNNKAWMKLPIEVFDGEPFSQALDDLKAQWEAILNNNASRLGLLLLACGLN